MISLWGFLAVTVPLVLTPGATTAVVLRNSFSSGVRAGLETALGANAGSVCFGLLSALGFTVVLQQWPGVWTLLQVVGFLYLGWLGLQSLYRAFVPRTSRGISLSACTRTASALTHVRDGFVTNASNPALATFYFVVLPQFITPGAPIARAALLLTGIHVTLAASWHIVWATAGGTLSHALNTGWPRRLLDLAAGSALLYLAGRIS